jgi:hypothetical protein
MEQHAQLLQDLQVICRRERITIGAFATDGDSEYDPVHETNCSRRMSRRCLASSTTMQSLVCSIF